jgi:autotransporter-associated beta strand protein
VFVGLSINEVPGQTTLYFGGTGNWTEAVWSTINGSPYTTNWISGSNVIFNVANSTVNFATTTVYDITANENVTLIPGGTFSTVAGHKVANITVVAGKLFDFGSQAISSAVGTGFIKNGEGSFALSGDTYSGGFTLNAGTLIAKGVNAMGSGGVLTINGGTLSANGNTNLSNKPSNIVIGGDFILGSSTSPAVSNANLTFNALTYLGTSANRTITLGGTGTYTFAGIISGVGSGLILNATAEGTLTLSGANSYNGGTTISDGILQLGAAGVLADAAAITLNGGSLKTGATTGFSETVGTLNLANSSTISLGTGVHSLSFAPSNAISWIGTTLTVLGWTGSAGTSGTAGQIFVGSDALGLTPSQLAKINFMGYSSGATILNTGEIVPFRMPSVTYSWIGSDNFSWSEPANWNPIRNTPAFTDVLQFNDGTVKIVTNVPTETIGQLKVSGNTSLTLQSSGANTLTVAGGDGVDMTLDSGSELNISGTSAIIIALSIGVTGNISGSMDFSNSPNQITAADASGITFNSGAVFIQNTNNTGNVFSNSVIGSVIFSSGSTFIQAAGSNPLAGTVTIFQKGSLFKFIATAAPSFSGRTYADFEFASTNQTAIGSNVVLIDNLTVKSGTLNFNTTGTPGHAIKGNISVSLGATLNFNPSNAGTVNFNGVLMQTVSGEGIIFLRKGSLMFLQA